jgi:hypothetical protein
MNLTDLQISTMNWHNGLTQANHLSTFFLTEPALASQVVTRVYNRHNGYKNALSFLTGGLGRTMELDNVVYKWPLMGDSEKAITVTGNFGDGSTTPGIANSTFRVKFAEKWFTIGDVIVPDNTSYQCRVMEEPYQSGADFVYTLQIVTNDPTVSLPVALIAAGAQFSKDYNVVEHDHSRTSGETHYATPFWMQNYLTTFRKHYSVTGAAAEKVMVISLMDPASNKVSNTWVKYAEWEFWAQWMDEIERAMIYGQLNTANNGVTNMKGKSGNAVYTGAGLEQQISPANKRFYTSLTEQVIRDFMDDLSFNGTEDGPREFVALCGRQFMNLFDQAMKVSASNYTLVDSKFVTGSGQELVLGGQFKTYIGLNGDKITLKETPLYNDVVRNRRLHPQTNRPVESYKATFLNFKLNRDGSSNVTKCVHKGREAVSTYVEGLYGPYGPKKNGTSATAVDGYEFHMMSECGIMLKDPTDAGQLILDVDNIS